MKNFFFIPLLFLISCNSSQDSTAETEAPEEIITEDHQPSNQVEETLVTPEETSLAGDYIENYPSGKLKMEGKLNANGNRDGLWISYYENGTKWSESYYDDGSKEGHSLSFFPSGQTRYIGEYKNDKKIGVWKFYDEDGELFKEETFE